MLMESAQAPNPVVTRSRLQLLLVEDQDSHAQIFQSLALNALPSFALDRAHDLVEAFDYLGKKRYDLVILDLGLPGTRGIDTLRRVLERFEECPVVVLTADADLKLGEEALRLGALDFLGKEEISRLSLARMLRYSLERWQHKRELVQAIENVEGFARAAAHDLKNPLSAMQSCCALIEMEFATGTVTDETLEVIRTLSDRSRRAAKLVDDLLEFSKLGKAAVQRQVVDLRELAESVLPNLEKEIVTSGGRVEIQDLGSACVDPGLMSQVFQNLIGNALKYRGEQRPVVRVEAEKIIGGEMVVWVEDNGRGFDMAAGSQLFEPLKRLNGSSVDGSGLGLSICKRIIEAHDGRIWFYSQPGAGATFCFSIPAA